MEHDTELPEVESSDADPDIFNITDYLAGELTYDATEAIERRLSEDDDFFEKVWPLVRIWTSSLPVSHRIAVNCLCRAADSDVARQVDDAARQMTMSTREMPTSSGEMTMSRGR